MEVMYFLKCIFSKVCLSKVYFCEMYPTCVSSKLCEFITCRRSRGEWVRLRAKGTLEGKQDWEE